MNQEIVVKKFGGTSLGSVERIRNVAARVLEDQKAGQSPVLVCSAMAGETNRLVGLAEDAFSGYRGSCYDMAVAAGEQVSIALVAMSIMKLGGKAKPFLAHQLGFHTDSSHSSARILRIDTSKLQAEIDKGVIPVVAGFQGVDMDYNITTLGRGGSDTSAVALAAAFGLNQCEIYTDVTGVFSADPRLVSRAREIKELSFDEMMEMSSLGSKVLHTRSVEIGAKNNVHIHVRSTFEKREGTWVRPEGENMEKVLVNGVTHETSTAIIKMYPLPESPKVLSDVFGLLSEKGIVVDIISQSFLEGKQRLAFSISTENVNSTKELMKELFPETKIEVMDFVSKLSIVGVGMKNHPGVASKFFKVLADNEIPVHLVTTSEIKVSAIIDQENLKKSAEAVHSVFELDKE